MARLKFPSELEPLVDPQSGRVSREWYRVLKLLEAVAVPEYTVAALPAKMQRSRLAFATDGRKAGEGVGAGTGVLVYDDGVAWRACDTSSTVAA